MFAKPQAKGTTFLKNPFSERKLILCHGGRTRFVRLNFPAQLSLLLCAAAFVGWSAFSTLFYVTYAPRVRESDDRAAALQASYDRLTAQVGVYRDHVAGLLQAMTGNQAQDGEGAADADAPAYAAQNEKLREEMTQIRDKMDEALFADASANGDAPLYKAVLQRDLMLSENEELRKRVADLETLISDMQDTQMLVFQKMGDLADGGMNEIETRLTDVRAQLAHAGLNMDSLLQRMRRENQSAAVGGPFIPAHMPDLKHKNLNISLVSLNTRLNRWYDLTALEEALPVGKPLDRIRVTSSFGARQDPFQDSPARHEAVDLGGMTGEPVYATAPGKVTRAGKWGWYGNIVEIDHGMGFRTRYAHMDKIFVQKGETVREGDRIGNVGSTGRSTGPHLHYEVRVKGAPVDPMKFIKASKNVFKK